ncbi:hypothetical protein [Azorhizobium sp. AG788]|uniref:glycosyltransferase n=1 Tax=Azorhizobium sp. AG788 TaxID=2183897 RepID=UPI00313A4606
MPISGTLIRRAAPISVLRVSDWRADAPVRVIVAIPACDEAERIGNCLDALASQEEWPGHFHRSRDFGIVLLVNNTSDQTFDMAVALLRARNLPFVCADVRLPAEHAHAGAARGLAMDAAADWLERVGNDTDGLILTTDADSRVPADWVRRTLAGLPGSIGAVAGRVDLDPSEEHELPCRLRRRRRDERAYEEVLLALSAVIDPLAHDPWPNHGTASGASLAVTLSAYRAIGGSPHVPCGEDRALVAALRWLDIPVRHDPELVVSTSARLAGRARDGFADTLRQRADVWESPGDEALEALPNALRRYMWRRRLRTWHRVGNLDASLWAAVFGLNVPSGEPKSGPFGAFWQKIETASPFLARVPLQRGLLAGHAEAGRQLLRDMRPSLFQAQEYETIGVRHLLAEGVD